MLVTGGATVIRLGPVLEPTLNKEYKQTNKQSMANVFPFHLPLLLLLTLYAIFCLLRITLSHCGFCLLATGLQNFPYGSPEPPPCCLGFAALRSLCGSPSHRPVAWALRLSEPPPCRLGFPALRSFAIMTSYSKQHPKLQTLFVLAVNCLRGLTLH